MSDTNSLLLATAILGIGAAGLYMYKSTEDENNEEILTHSTDTNNNDSNSINNWFNFKFYDNEEDQDQDEDEYTIDKNSKKEKEIFLGEESKVRNRGGRTKRTRRTTGTKRRYY
jgi:hypothetical protein